MYFKDCLWKTAQKEEVREGSENVHTWPLKMIYHCWLTAVAQVIAAI